MPSGVSSWTAMRWSLRWLPSRYLMCTWCTEGTSTRLGFMPDTTEPAGRIQVAPQQRELLDQVLDKWSLQVLDELCEQPLRFNELRRAIPVVTQKSLTATLRRLERNGMVDRVIVSSRPIAVEYRISQLG